MHVGAGQAPRETASDHMRTQIHRRMLTPASNLGRGALPVFRPVGQLVLVGVRQVAAAVGKGAPGPRRSAGLCINCLLYTYPGLDDDQVGDLSGSGIRVEPSDGDENRTTWGRCWLVWCRRTSRQSKFKARSAYSWETVSHPYRLNWRRRFLRGGH